MLPTLARARSKPIPTFTALNYVQWSVNADGEITNMGGGGADHLTIDAASQIGQNVFVIYEQMPQMAAVFHRLMAGETIKEVVLGGQRLWFLDAFPIWTNGVITGATGVSFPLEPALERSGPRRRKWEIRGMPMGRGDARFRNGDKFVKVEGEDGVMFGCRISDGDFIGMAAEFGRYMQLVEDSSPPSPSLSVRERLRLLP